MPKAQAKLSLSFCQTVTRARHGGVFNFCFFRRSYFVRIAALMVTMRALQTEADLERSSSLNWTAGCVASSMASFCAVDASAYRLPD